MKTPIYLFANWKMYLDLPESVAMARELSSVAKKHASRTVMTVFPTALALASVAEELKKTTIAVGAQNVYWVAKGGYSGEVSAEMFKQAGASFALVGHSERRHIFRENNHETRQKFEAVLEAGLTPVLCVGETLPEKQNGFTEEIVETQLRAAFTGLHWPAGKPLIIAYEPVWAISSGLGAEAAGGFCDASYAQTMALKIKQLLHGLVPTEMPSVLYGGSVRPTTVAEYLAQPDINGVLVGAASTQHDSWLGIVAEAERGS